jgi:STE24 endopeptidase
MNAVAVFTAALIALRLAAELALSAFNRAETRRHAGTPPPAVAAVMDDVTYERSVAYTLARSIFGDVEEVFDALVLGAAVFSGILPRLYARIAHWGAPGSAWAGAAFILAAIILLSVPSLPFEAWRQFHLEAKFGFNRSTPRLWIADKLKGLGLMLALGFPLLWALLALTRSSGNSWWIWAAALLFGFPLAMIVLYPMLIQPLFNKLQPLPEGSLRARLLSLGDRTGFRASKIEVMDGSKRSAHSNAYFTGFGRFRRIVLFDTLVEQLSAEELEAVLAHEIGHYRLRHIPKMLAASGAAVFAGFAVLAWLARSPWFNMAFGFPPGLLAPSFLLFGLLSGLVTFWFAPVLNWVSRRHEYEADAFARQAVAGPASMISALRRLAQKNLSNLTPHPWFSAFFYSHPTLVERERALSE